MPNALRNAKIARALVLPLSAACALMGVVAALPAVVAAPPGAPAVRANPTPATLTIPAPPAIPSPLSFADEVSGRHLLYDTRGAYRKAAGVTFAAQWTGGQGGIGEAVMPGRTGKETFSTAPDRKIAVMVETVAPNGEHEIRRAAADGTELVTSHFFQAGPDATDARRTTARLTLDEATDLPRALAQIQLDPATRAAAYTLDPRAYVAGADATLWLAGHETLPDGTRVAIVDQVENQNIDDRQRNRKRICRYAIEAESHRLRRFELWEVDGERPQRARRTRHKEANGTVTFTETPGYASTVNYRREDYTKVALTDSAPAGPWTLAVPANYVEKPLPAVDLPAQKKLRSAEELDPRALRLLERWRTARERFVSLNTEIDVADVDVPRTAESRTLRRQQNSAIRYQLVYRRPGKAHITMTTLSGGGFRRGEPINGTLVSDGEQATWTRANGGGDRTVPMRNPAALLETLNRLQIRDPFNALSGILAPPPETDNVDKLTYDGQTLIDGRTPVESITYRRNIDRRNGQSETNYTMQVFFGADGLPRWIRTRIVTDLNGRLERDQPPIETIDIQFVNLLTDSEPPSASFVRPKG